MFHAHEKAIRRVAAAAAFIALGGLIVFLHDSGSSGHTFELLGLGICKPTDPEGVAPPIEPRVDAQAGEGKLIGLATLYQPTLVVARTDRNWPVSVQDVLLLRYGSVGTCQFSRRASAGRPRLADLRPGAGAGDYLVYPTPIADAQQQFLAFATSNGIPYEVAATWTVNPKADPYATGEEYTYVSDKPPPATKTGRLLPAGMTSIQYWFFYPFNYLPILARVHQLAQNPAAATLLNRDYHQGDWEHVDVILDAARQPRYLFLAVHDKGQLLDWPAGRASAGVTLDGTHPILYAAFGAHGTYATCGARHRFGTDFPVCPTSRTLANAGVDPAVFVFGWGKTPLVELKPDSWACWRGRFGYVPPKHNDTSKIGAGPLAPLVQEGDACA